MIGLLFIGIVLCSNQFEMINRNALKNEEEDESLFYAYSYDKTKNCTDDWRNCVVEEKVYYKNDTKYKKYNNGKESEKSFQIISEEDLYENKQALNDYATIRKKGSWGIDISEDFIYFDEYYFASNLIIDYGGKTLSATGTTVNLLLLTNATFDSYSFAAKEVRLVETEVAPEKETFPTDVKESYKHFGQKLSFAFPNFRTGDLGINGIKQLIAWYGPVLVDFKVNKASLDEYMKKKDKNAILKVPTKCSETERFNLKLLIFGWVEAKGENPEYWIGKTLYEPKTASNARNADDFNGSIVKFEIGKNNDDYDTENPSCIISCFYNEKDYNSDTSYGIIP